MRDFCYLCIIGMVLCLACIAYQIGYANGAIDSQNQQTSMISLMREVK